MLHEVAGRATDRVAPELWPDLAAALGLPDAEAAQRHVRGLGRRITHLSRLTWHRVDAVLGPAGRPASGGVPELDRVAPGVAVSRDEVVLDRGTRPARTRCCCCARPPRPPSASWCWPPPPPPGWPARAPPLPEPWAGEARNLFARLLAAGPGLLGVWETLDETGALERVLPEWERVRLLPHASVVHRFTVDRHLVETCIEASRADPPGRPRPTC